jgi:hypothetical protein
LEGASFEPFERHAFRSRHTVVPAAESVEGAERQQATEYVAQRPS